jgi:hypothetical protein
MWKSSKVEATGYTPRGCIPINAVRNTLLRVLTSSKFKCYCTLCVELAKRLTFMAQRRVTLSLSNSMFMAGTSMLDPRTLAPLSSSNLENEAKWRTWT